MEERHMKHKWSFNCISGVMVSVLFPSAVDSGFEPSLTKDYTIYICCFSAKLSALRCEGKDYKNPPYRVGLA